MTSLTIGINPHIVVNYNNVVMGIIFPDMTTIGSSSLLANKHDVSDIGKFYLFNINMSPNNKMMFI